MWCSFEFRTMMLIFWYITLTVWNSWLIWHCLTFTMIRMMAPGHSINAGHQAFWASCRVIHTFIQQSLFEITPIVRRLSTVSQTSNRPKRILFGCSAGWSILAIPCCRRKSAIVLTLFSNRLWLMGTMLAGLCRSDIDYNHHWSCLKWA